jgi:hypothetical protein
VEELDAGAGVTTAGTLLSLLLSLLMLSLLVLEANLTGVAGKEVSSSSVGVDSAM